MDNQVDFFSAARDAAIEWARNILATPSDQVLILDTETTGLHKTAEIVQLAVIDLSGTVVIDTLVKTKYLIPQEATNIHGITNDMVLEAPYWNSVFPWLENAVRGNTVVIYNAEYDTRIIQQTCQLNNIRPLLGAQSIQCAMLIYAEFIGEWNDYRGNFKWHRLTGGDHTALGDCKATLALIQRMAYAKLSTEAKL